MKEKFLVINAGSSSLKFSLYEMPEKKELVNGYIEKIGNADSCYTLKYNGKKEEFSKEIKNHVDAVQTMLDELISKHFVESLDEIKGVGHRVLHGGEFYSDSVLIDDEVLNNIKALTKLGPLHHPGEIAGIESMRELLPEVPEVAVFDTAFHQTMPEENYMYPVPYEWYEKYGVRKYGFHGTSHKYITETMKEKLGKEDPNMIICHIGSGASISCIKDGKCYDTTMGLTPLDGLMMCTRSGSIDPSILEYVCKESGMDISEVTTLLNKKSGFLGVTGYSDNRDVQKAAENGDEKSALALKMIKRSILNYIAQYYFELRGDVDAIIFTAGIGENDIGLREWLVNAMSSIMNIELDKEANDNISRYKSNQTGTITTPNSKVKVMVVPTDEESMILKDTIRISKEASTDKNKTLEK